MTRDGKATLKYSREVATNVVDCDQVAWHDNPRCIKVLHLTNILSRLVSFDYYTVSC